MPPKSAVERSSYRSEIDDLLSEGKSPRFISNWLKNLKKNPESISHTAINTYRKKKFNVAKEATERYHERQSKKKLEDAVEKQVSDLEYCDEIIQLAHKVDLKVDPENKVTELDIKKLGLQAIKTKADLFKQGEGEDHEFIVRIEGVEPDDKDSNVHSVSETEEVDRE